MSWKRKTASRRPQRCNKIAAATLLLAAALATVGNVSAASALPPHQQAVFASSSAAPPRPTLARSSSATELLAKSHKSWLVSAKDTILSKVTGFLSAAIPDARYFSWDLDQLSDYGDTDALDGGLFGDTAGLNWGGGTLEVVRSQAIFLTRAAAFGPHVTSDEGLRGSLLPIDLFYHMPKDSKPTNYSNHACPYKGGPGWRREEFINSWDDADSRRLYSSFAPDETWINEEHGAPKPPKDWIALVERGGGCGFAAKVRVAQELGAIAVVVGDAPSPSWDGGKDRDPSEEGDPGLSGKRLITMFAPGDTSDIRIPSTFVTRPSFLDLTRLINELERDEEKWEHDQTGNKPDTLRGLEIVISKDDLLWEWPLIDVGILLLLLPSIMTVFTLIVHRIRMIRQRRKERAPELVVLGLPCLIWRSNGQPWEKIEGPDVDPGPGNGMSTDTTPANGEATSPGDLESGTATSENIPLLQEDENGAGPSRRPTSTVKVPPPPSLEPGRTYFSTDECAICLCDFVDGDRVRVLPCGHIFHRQEIDDWLVRVKKLCPICKRDITVPIPPAPPMPEQPQSQPLVDVEPPK